MRSERKEKWAERREEGEETQREGEEGQGPVGHLELRKITCCLSSSKSSPVGAGPGDRERFRGGGRKEGWRALSPSNSARLPSSVLQRGGCPTLPARSSAVILQRTLESHSPLLGLVIGASVLSSHWLRVQP